MLLLTETNTPIDINSIPASVLQETQINFCVFDLTISDQIDYYFYPIIQIVSFVSPTYVINIQGNTISLPNSYKVLIGEKYSDSLEFLDIEECMHRDFDAFLFNPLSSYKGTFSKIEVISILPDQKWLIPKIKNDHILLSPISKSKNSLCVFLTNDCSKVDTINMNILL